MGFLVLRFLLPTDEDLFAPKIFTSFWLIFVLTVPVCEPLENPLGAVRLRDGGRQVRRLDVEQGARDLPE